MRGLTLQQPWATLCAIGSKANETRSWRTGYRGRVAIHSSAATPTWCRELMRVEPWLSHLQGQPMPVGCVLAVATLADCVPVTDTLVRDLTRTEHTFGDYSPGRFVFKLRDVHPLRKPIPMKGMLGLWRIEPATEIRLLTQAGLA